VTKRGRGVTSYNTDEKGARRGNPVAPSDIRKNPKQQGKGKPEKGKRGSQENSLLHKLSLEGMETSAPKRKRHGQNRTSVVI